MTLRARLSLAFALFAALPLAATLWPVSRALSRALEAEHEARLDGAAHAVLGELTRLAAQASLSVQDLAASPEAEAFAREHAAGAAPAEEAGRAAEWSAARGLGVLAVADPEGRVVSSAHLPGRAGDVDPDLAALFRTAPAGHAVPRVLARAGPDGVEPVLALVAWRPLPSPASRGGGGPGTSELPGGGALRVVAGGFLGRELAARLAALTGGAVTVRAADGALLAEAQAPRADDGGPHPGLPLPAALSRLLGRLGAASRTLPLGPPEAVAASVEVSVASEGLARARATVLLAFLGALAAAALAAAVAGRLVAMRVTRPVEALRDAAARVAAGDLGARVAVSATGEVGDLVRAFNEMTADLAQSRSRLAQAERIAAWREVARRLAHEIKNPLTPIAMSVETLRDALERRRPDFPEIFEEGTRAISDEVRRLKRIVDEFSRFARLPAPERAPVAPEELVAAALALFPAPPAGVTIAREVAPGLPAVLADRDQVLQVLLNLVRNALDALAGSGGTLALRAARAPGGVAFTLRDGGPGIAPGDLERVFEPYFTTKEGGTGLGLAIARRIAEEHGGTLEVESSPGEGAAFTLTLPEAPAAAVTSPASP
jgi:two-component system nitrogen regulation sensor histidine kinase NtrY